VAGWLGWGAVWTDESVLVSGSRGVGERRLAMGAVSTDWVEEGSGGRSAVWYRLPCYGVMLWCEEPLTTKAMRGYLCAVVVLRGLPCRVEQMHCKRRLLSKSK
jgi:hypothetical protein